MSNTFFCGKPLNFNNERSIEKAHRLSYWLLSFLQVEPKKLL